jgi:hypothetical protein
MGFTKTYTGQADVNNLLDYSGDIELKQILPLSVMGNVPDI